MRPWPLSISESSSSGPEATNLGPKLWDVPWAMTGSVRQGGGRAGSGRGQGVGITALS